MSLLCLFLIALAHATPAQLPSPASLDSSREAQVASGAIVVVPGAIKVETGLSVTGVAELNTTPERLWAALLDFPARLQGNSSLKAVYTYNGIPQPHLLPVGTEQWWKFELSIMGMPISYHNHYRFDSSAGWLIHELDHNMPNDLVDSWGIFQVFPGSYKSHRLQYTAMTNVGHSLPAAVEEWLGGKGVMQFLVDVVNRARG